MIATKEEYQKALLNLRDAGRFRNTKYRDMLKAHYLADKHTITATQLANAVGYANFNAANLQYGLLAHEIAKELNYQPTKRDNGESMWFLAIASGHKPSDDTSNGHYEFVMRPELIEALEQMPGWLK